MKKLCDRCGGIVPLEEVGSAMLCQKCSEEIEPELKRIEESGKEVLNVLVIARRHLKARYARSRISLIDVPDKLKERLNKRSKEEGLSERDIILSSLVDYLETPLTKPTDLDKLFSMI